MGMRVITAVSMPDFATRNLMYRDLLLCVVTLSYCILRWRIKGSASAVFVIQHRKAVLCSLRYLLCTYAYNKLLMAWEGVLYAEYSTRDRVSRTIQHSALPRSVLFS